MRPPRWIRVSASVREPDGPVDLRSKHWLVQEQSVADLVSVIAEQMEQERGVVVQERRRRARFLLAKSNNTG